MGLFGLKTGIEFAHFGLERMNVFIVSCDQFQMNKNETGICEFEMHLKKFFVCALI